MVFNNSIWEKHKLAREITTRYFGQNTVVGTIDKTKEIEQWYQEAITFLDYLGTAVHINSAEVFTKYLEWSATFHQEEETARNILTGILTAMRTVLENQYGDREQARILQFLDAGIQHVSGQRFAPNSFLVDENPLLAEVKQYLGFLLNRERYEAAKMVEDLVNKGVEIKDVYEHIFQVSQYEVGFLWQTHRISVAQEHYCTAATQFIMSRLYPNIFQPDKRGFTFVGCTVEGELHELGIRMLADFFEMDGWDTHYLGAGMPMADLIEALHQHQADVLAISVTLAVHLDKVESMIQHIRSHPGLAHIKVLAGGYPFLLIPDLWKQVGADASAGTARQAIEVAHTLIKRE